MVTVTSAVQGPPKSLFPLWQCGSERGYVTLGCVTRDLASADGLTFTWKDNTGKSLTDFVQYPAVQANGGFTSVSHLRVQVSEWDQRKKYECEVKNSAGSKKADLLKPEEIQIEPIITISSRTTDDSVELFCWLEGFSPKPIKVEWKEGNTLLQDKSTLKIFESSREGKKVFYALSMISINANKSNEGTEFTCTAMQKTKKYSESWNKCKAKSTSTPQIRLEKPHLVSILTGQPVTASCSVETELIPKVLWFVNDKEITETISTDKQRERTISNLTISTEEWKTAKTITCRASHSCFIHTEKQISFSDPKKTPTVVIRRNLEDIQKGHTEVLECTATDLPSGELLVTFQANGTKFSEDQYVNLPEGLDSLTRRVTVPITNQKKENRFTCQIQSQSSLWKSNSIGNIFGDPSVDLSVVTSVDTKGSQTQNLLCSGTGFNPTITWNKTLNIAHSKTTMEADGRVKVISEVMVPQQDWYKGETFTCQFSDQHKVKGKSISICSVNPEFVQMPQVYLLAPSIKDMRESKVSVTCLLLGHKLDTFTISWKLGDISTSKDVTKTPITVYGNGTESLSSVLKVAITQWNSYAKVVCEVKHLCPKEPRKQSISKTRDPKKTPTVVIRRNLEDIQKGHTEVLECTATDLPSGELLVTFQANGTKFSEDQYVNLPEDLDSLTRHVTVPITNQKKENRFTCQIQSQSSLWKSNSIGNIFGDPSVDLSVVTSVDTKKSQTQNLLCSGTGFNPTITWNKTLNIAHSKTTMEADGRVKVISEVMVPQQDWYKGETFTCQFSDQHELKEKSISICSVNPEFVQMPQVYLLAPSIKDMRESKVSVTCLLLGHKLDTFTISWKLGDISNSKDVTKTPITVYGNGTESLSSVLKVAITQWNSYAKVVCEVKHLCSKEPRKHSISKRDPKKTPTVVIRRNLEDIQKGHTEVLECTATDLPSGELLVTFQANGTKFSEDQYVNLPEGLDSLTRRVTVPITNQKKENRFTCQIQSQSSLWKSNSIGNIFGDPSVDLSVVTSVDTKGSQTQNLLCSGTGFNPTITWNKTLNIAHSKTTMEADGRVKVISEVMVPQQDWYKGETFTCQFSDQHKVKGKSISICSVNPEFVQMPQVYLLAPSIKDMRESKVSVTCLLLGHKLDTFTISWKLGDISTSKDVTKTPTSVYGNGTESLSSVLKVAITQWNSYAKVVCEVKHLCSKEPRKHSISKRDPKKTPTVVIRRNLEDIQKGHTEVLECTATDLPSGELLVTFQANGTKFSEDQYVNLPEGLDSLTRRVTVPITNQKKENRFTCQIQSQSSLWKSNSIGNIFGDPSVDLSVVTSVDTKGSQTQNLLCSGTGFNPTITWNKTLNIAHSKTTMEADGRVKVISEVMVPQQDWYKGETFTCQFSDQHELKEKSISICSVNPEFVQMPQVYLLAPSIKDMRKSKVSVTCLLLGHKLDTFTISWKLGDISTSKDVTKTPTSVYGNGTESLSSVLKVAITQWNSYAKVVCEVKHLCSKEPRKHSISKTRDPKSPTIRILSPSDDELSGVHNTSLICFVEGFHPADISVHWELNGIRLDASRFSNSPVSMQSERAAYSMHSRLTLLASKMENGDFSCVVNHESSETPIKGTINNIYASVMQHAPSVKLLQGQDELVCLVNGYSPSAINITWFRNNVTVKQENDTSSSDKGPDGKFNIRSHLYIQAFEWVPGDKYTCQVEHITGIISRFLSKTEFIEKTIYYDENKAEPAIMDQSEETWNMACAFIILFIISFIYGCSMTLVKVKTAEYKMKK
ncbi:uncharacterized protein ighd isoform X2 [Tachysurus fulvidraco]|nr:uncharacterized protein ighd isoform X2 [Tachysurus fulvidraco]